jgi:hypothetical protein
MYRNRVIQLLPSTTCFCDARGNAHHRGIKRFVMDMGVVTSRACVRWKKDCRGEGAAASHAA